MRIALVTHQFFPAFYTGVERLALNLALQLQRMGHQPLVVSSAPHSVGHLRPYAVSGVPVRTVETYRTELARPWIYDGRVGPDFGRILDEERIQLVHVMSPIRMSAAFGEARARGLPVVAHLPDFGYMCPRLNLLRVGGEVCWSPEEGLACIAACRIAPGPERLAWARATLANAAAVVSPCRFTIDLHEHSGFDTDGWHHVSWGVDYALHERRLPAPRGDTLTVGFIGTLLPHKGAHVLVEALRLLEGAPIRLLLYGGSFHEERYEAELRERAARDDRVVFAGPYAHEELPALLARLDAVAIPSLWHENLPTTGLNAIASGVPILVSELGGMTELLRTYDCGLAFRTGDAEDLARLLRELMNDRLPLEEIRGRMSYPPSLEEEAWRLEAVYEAALAAAP